MRTIEQTVYSFDELSESAKEKARAWYREGLDFDGEFVIDEAVEIARILGIEINQQPVKLMNGSTRNKPNVFWSGFSSQGNGASFEGHYSYTKGSAKRIRKYSPLDAELHRIADALRDLQKRHFYKLTANITTSGNYSHEYSMRLDADCNGRDMDLPEEDLLELMRDFARWVYAALEREYDWCNSDEAVDDALIINEYEFTENGELA